jgi:hypothetical protein
VPNRWFGRGVEWELEENSSEGLEALTAAAAADMLLALHYL